MKRSRHVSLKAVFLAAFAVGAAVFARADTILSEYVGNLTWKYTITNGAARVYGGHMKSAIGWTTGEVSVPDTLGGLPVKHIGSYAFFELWNMTSLRVPESVETIEFYACRNCSNLVSVTMPSDLTTLGDAVFFNCQKLEVGYIPDSVTSMGRDTFWGCSSMTNVKFSAHVTSLGAMTCYNCDNLTEVTIPDCVTNIGVSAFLSCDNLQSVTLPKGEVTFGNYAFNNCLSLEVVDLPSGFTDFDNAFHNCPSLTTARIRQDIPYVDPASFAGCPTLTAILVEDGNAAYKSIGGVLYDATGTELVAWPAALQPVEVPPTVERIGDHAFGWTSDKSAISIPEGVEVSEHAFADPPPDEPEVPEDPVDPPVPEQPREGIYIYRDCFRIIPGGIPHLACTVPGLTGIDYAVDRFETNNWQVVFHGSGVDDPRVKIAKEGEHYVDDNDMPPHAYEVSATAYPFVFEFCNWYRNMVLNSHTWYGYISLGLDENAELVILESAICNEQNELLVNGSEVVVPPDPFVDPATGCETNTFYATSERTPHILHRRDTAFDFVIFNYTESCWDVSINHSSGRGYVALTSPGSYIGDDTFSEGRTTCDYDNGDLFFMAFKWWPDANDTTRRTRYGWMAIGLRDGVPAVLASEMSETAGAPFVARGFEGVDDGPDDPVEGLIWRCNFNNGVQWMDATNMPEVASHLMVTGLYFEASIDDGRYSGRRCVKVGGLHGARAWFSVNERVNGGLGPRYVPGKWQTLKTSFKKNSSRAWTEGDPPLYPTSAPPSAGTIGPEFIFTPACVINIDDKIALYYFDCDDGHGTCCWQINAGIANAVGGLVSGDVRLAEKEGGSGLASPLGNWVTVEIEAVNDGSPHGLAYRIYIDGILACSQADGSTVFRARPEASDRTGVTALGLGGNASIDDVVFSSTTIDPLAGIYISPSRFGPANKELAAGELDALACIIGFESLSGLERITMYPWEDDSGCEPLDAPKMCIDLGISPFHVKPDSDDGKGLTLFFKNPTAVRAIGIDPAACTVTGQIIPAEGTHIVQQPQRFMFGINHIMDFGTPYAHGEEYGYQMYWHGDRFQLDVSNYAASNGVFTITYDSKFSNEGSAFFSLEVKDFRYW